MTQRSESADVIAVGDVYINRKYPETAVAGVKDAFDAADLRIGNLESAVTDEGEKGDLIPDTLITGPEAVDGLTYAGFDMMGVANNHVMDLGEPALVDTLDRLEEHGIKYAGAGRDRDEAEQPAITESNGITFGLVTFEATQRTLHLLAKAQAERGGINMVRVSTLYPEPHIELTDLENMRRIISSVASEVDVLFTMFHFGIGRTRTIPQKALAREAIDHGADAVLGAHAHFVQGVEIYDSAPILYGLGHFFWDSFYKEKTLLDEHSFTRDTVLSRLETTSDGVSEVELQPVRITESSDQPTIVPPGSDAFERIADQIVTLSERAGTDVDRADDRLVITT